MNKVENLPHKVVVLIMLVISSSRAIAQTALSCDSLFQLARKEAFDRKNLPVAIQLSREALHNCPAYTDIAIFLGRLYTWVHQPDSARLVLSPIFYQHSDNEDAAIALTDLESWNDRPLEALVYCDAGLTAHPGSHALLLKKTKLLIDLHRYKEAGGLADSLLNSDPGNSELRLLASNIKYSFVKGQLGFYYDYVYFDKQFDAPWHLASVDYKQQTKFGPLIGRINYANRFRSNGVQAEVDAYPHFSPTFYSYMNVGYSHDVGVFPNYRAGFSLYCNLPHAFEGEAGFRCLYFTSSTWIYTLSIGKYYKNYWFNFRCYLTPGKEGASQSFALTGRYYFGGADDYWTLGAGTGVSPDDRSNNIQLNSSSSLRSNKLTAGYNRSFRKITILFVSATWLRQQYLPHTDGNQLDLGIGIQRRF